MEERMKYRFVYLGMLLAVLALSACGGSKNYPGPGESYPLPLVEEIPTNTPLPTVAPGAAAYPEIASDSSVTWSQAETMMRNGEVAEILLLKDLWFNLSLKDGRLLKSQQPAADSIDVVIKDCGDACAAIEISSE
jgi:hypothetical protein